MPVEKPYKWKSADYTYEILKILKKIFTKFRSSKLWFVHLVSVLKMICMMFFKKLLLSHINVHVYFIIVLYMFTYKQMGSLTLFSIFLINSREYLYLVPVPHHTI